MSGTEIVFFVAFASLAVFMLWSLLNLSSSPLHPVQRLWWMLSIVILPGIGSAAWLWWIKRYYPRRKAADPSWDPAERRSSTAMPGRPRPGRGKYRSPHT